jgi:hypothetical protein
LIFIYICISINNYSIISELGVLPIVDKTQQVVVEFGVQNVNVVKKRSVTSANASASEEQHYNARKLKSVEMMNATITEEHFNKYSEEAQMFFGKRKEKKTVSPVH